MLNTEVYSLKNAAKVTKTLLFALIKLSLTVLAFYIIRKHITINPLEHVNQSTLTYLSLALGFAFFIVILQALRWQYLITLFNVRLKYSNCLPAIWFGHFVNSVMPTGTAGDILRNYTLRYSENTSKWVWVKSFLFEKYVAAASALLLSCITFLTVVRTELPMLLMGLIGAIFVMILLVPFLGEKVLSMFKFAKVEEYVTRLANTMKHLSSVYTDKKGLYAFIISLLVNLIMCTVFYIIALAYNAPITVLQAVFTVPVFTLLASLPISYAGWGIRELSCVGILKFFGTPLSLAVTVSVTYGLILLLSSLPGILFGYAFYTHTRRLASSSS